MVSIEEHLNNLIRHIELVRQATTLLGKRLIAQGRQEFGRILIARGFVHDASKFHGIEWDYLHAGKDVPVDKLELAIKQHTRTNDHHPEFHGGFENMGEIDIAEMACDWYARSMEFGTGLREWIKNTAVEKYRLSGDNYKKLDNFIDLLLEDSFVKR